MPRLFRSPSPHRSATAVLLLAALGGCSLPSQSEPQGRAAAVSAAGGIATLVPVEPIAVHESETPGGRFAVFNVTPRIEQRPADAPYPLLLTGLVAARDRTDPSQRIFRAIFAITYRSQDTGKGSPSARQRFSTIAIGRHVPGPLLEVDHDLRCGTADGCLYTETVSTFLPEADLRAAAAAGRALAFRLEGTMPVDGAIPPEQVSALLARVDSVAR